MPPESVASNRVYEIDGIRGWAALVVLMFHLTCQTFGAIRSEFRSPILRALVDGNLAIYVFFVLSGDALSLCYTRLEGPGIKPRMIAKRYFRLAGPIVFSCIVVYCLMKLGLTFNKATSPMIQSTWLSEFLSFEPSFKHAIKTGLIGVFTGGYSDISYNPFMWPMAQELAGSLLVFAFGVLYPRVKRPALLLAVCALYLIALDSLYALFVIGIFLGRLRAIGIFARLQDGRHSRTLTVALLAAVILLLLTRVSPFKFRYVDPRVLAAAIVIWTVYSSKALTSLMRTSLSRFLGKISFPVYFIQFSVIVSWTSWTIVAGKSFSSSIWLPPYATIVSSAAIVIGMASAIEVAEAWYLRKIDKWIGYILISTW